MTLRAIMMVAVFVSGVTLYHINARAADSLDFRVIDGDTINVPMELVQGMPARISIRLYGINTPETRGAKCQAERTAGDAAKVYVRDRLAHAYEKNLNIKVSYKSWDKYGGRIDGFILINGQDLAQDLVKNGFAVPYKGGKRVNVWCNK